MNIDIQSFIQKHTFPSCCITSNIWWDIFQCFWHYTYDQSSTIVDSHTYYDVASLTKVMVTIPALMILYDRWLLNIQQRVSDYFPAFSKHKKGYITIENLVLANSWLSKIYWYHKETTKQEMIEIISDVIPDFEIWKKIFYNDISYILLWEIIQKISWKKIWEFITSEFFNKLGITASFWPLEPTICTPSREKDSRFDSKCQWFADDKKVYVMWNETWFAWLFANIQDLKLFAEFMISDGAKIIKKETLDLFTSQIQNTDRTYWWNINTAETELRTLIWYTHHSVWQHSGLPTEPQFITIPWSSRPSNTLFHNGFTGTSVLINRELKTYLGFLSNRTYEMQDTKAIVEFRKELYGTISPKLTS